MTLVQKFTEKYGVNPIQLVADAHLKNLGLAKAFLNRLEKSKRLKRLLENYIDDKNLKIEVNNEFLKDLVESFAEAKEKFPENVKASVDTGTKFEVPNQMSGIPKSKGTLENFKDIVGTDDLRPIMMGVYVSEDGFIVGTDAHKLVKQKNNGLLSQTDYAGKIIDLTKYIKSKGKLIDFVDGVYPKYDAVIPKDTPYEDRALSTYAFYNYVKSALDVKRLVDAEIFNINFNLMTETSGETTMFSFAYHVLFDALNFAMLNGWDVFTLRYSEPNRAVVFDFGGDNIILVMPIIDSYGSGASGGSTGTIPLTTEEVEEKYRAGLSSQKASKPKASKPVRPSAPVSSEPFKKFEGELSDTTYIHRSQIDSIKLVSGEVLGKNDIIDGIYRINKKMATGGGIYSSDEMYVLKVYDLKGNLLDDSIRFRERNERRAKEHAIYYYEDDMRDKYGSDLMFTVELAKPKMAHGGSMYAGGGNMFEKPIAMYREVSGKTRNLPQSTEVYESEINRFIDYVHDFYEEEGYSKAEVKTAVNKYLSDLGNQDTYGGGDSIDREKVYKYLESDSLEKSYKSGLITQSEYEQMKSQKEKKYATGGSMYAGGGKIPSRPFLVEIKPLFKGEEPHIVRISPDSVGEFTAGYTIYADANSTRKVGYLPKHEMENKIENGEYKIITDSKMAHGGSMYADGGGVDEVKYFYIKGRNEYAPQNLKDTYAEFYTENDLIEYLNKWKGNKDVSFNSITKVYNNGESKDVTDFYLKNLYSKNKLAHGGSMSSSYEAGDKVTFKSVMGGTKTGLIVSKLGEDGFRIKTEDGFATVKKSAIV